MSGFAAAAYVDPATARGGGTGTDPRAHVVVTVTGEAPPRFQTRSPPHTGDRPGPGIRASSEETAMTTAKSVTESFLEQQVKLLEAQDTAGLAQRYAPDAVFVRFDRVAVGRDEIKQLFDDYLGQNPTISAMDALQLTEDVIFYQAAETLDGTLTTAVGTLVFREGLVWRQTVSFVKHRPE